MSVPSLRRNRTLASCEPCRKGKVRCDHGNPICASCQRRDLHSQCWYHPAPLTKKRTLQATNLSNLAEPSGMAEGGDSCRGNSHCHSAEALSVGPRHLHTWPFMSADSNDQVSQSAILVDQNHNIKAQDEYLALMEDIVSQLRFLPFIEKQLDGYYSFSQVALVPRQIVVQLLASIRFGLLTSGHITEERNSEIALCFSSQLAKQLLRSSSLDISITPDLDLEAFCALFCGANLRIETLGLLYTMTARSCLYDISQGFDERQTGGFIQKMSRYSNLSLRLARELSPQTTDLTIWLAHENLQLMTLLEGDSSLGVWRRVGDFATDLLVLGLNREVTYSALPFFLAQCRRRNFARAYYLDKVFATVFNRPPRTSARHADCKLPLDLSDDKLFTSSERLQEAKRSLTPEGWNTDGRHRIATWGRIRYILAEFCEEIVDYQFRSIHIADTVKLRDISNRCYRVWNTLPHFLRYSQDCWSSDLPLAFCYLHAKVYLSYLHIHFQIYSLISHCDNNLTPLPELLEISADMLETIIQMSICRRKSSFSPRDLSGVILSYGLPCAMILSAAVDAAMHDPSKGTVLPPGIKASNIIRNISVLVSQLENISSPSKTNHILCLRASQAITYKLDRILDRSITTATLTTPEPGPTPPALDSLSPIDLGDTDVCDFVDWNQFDLADWAMTFDLDSIAHE